MTSDSKEREAPNAPLKTQKEQRATDAAQAVSEYKAAGDAVRAKTARLKELRLGREVAYKEAKAKQGKKLK
jgi:hypothetical protein